MSVIESTRTRTLTNENTPLLSNDFERSQRLSESIRYDSTSSATQTRLKISHCRRAFCLIVLFDLLMTVVLWLFECGTQSSEKYPFFEVMKDHVIKYSIYSSIFDILLLSTFRFSFLQLTYAILRLNHWWPVAVSTALCNCLTIAKIFFIFLKNILNIPMTVVNLAFSFCITWIEVWFLDSKVLPEEAQIAERLSIQGQPNIYDYERSGFHPLFRPFSTIPPSSKYFSPAASIEPSDYEKNEELEKTLDASTMEIYNQGKYAFDRILHLYNNQDIWKLEQKKSDDTVYSFEDPEYGKTFKLVANITEFQPFYIFENILKKGNEFPEWNKSISSVKTLQTISENCLITVEVSAPAAMGLISSREFVTVRMIDQVNGKTLLDPPLYVSAGISTDKLDDELDNCDFVRGFNGPTGFIITSAQSPYSSTLVWILNTDLKGNLSRGLVNRNLVSTMFSFSNSMRKRLEEILES